MRPPSQPRHPSLVRLMEVALQANGLTRASDLAEALDESSATLTNWATRGISKSGAMKAQGVYGCSASWILTGKGPRLVTADGRTKASPSQAIERLGEALVMVDELTRAQIRPLLEQLLQSPEDAVDIGRRLDLTLKNSSSLNAVEAAKKG